MWYDEYFRKGNIFQLNDPEDEKELREYEQTLLAHGIMYREVIFATPCGEEYISVSQNNQVT